MIHVQTCQNPVTIGYNQLASVACGSHLIHELPILSYLFTLIYNVWCQRVNIRFLFTTLKMVLEMFFFGSQIRITYKETC